MLRDGCCETKVGGVLLAGVKCGVAVATKASHCLTGFGARWEGLDCNVVLLHQCERVLFVLTL